MKAAPRALVIDDEADVRNILSLMLGRLGYHTRMAENGAAGLKALETEGAVDVVFVDWRMPGMDGLTFLKAVRAKPDLQKTRVMMVTGVNELDEISEALDAGADEYLMKPITQQMLREKLTIMGL